VIDHGGTFIPGDSEGSIKLAASDGGDFLYRWCDPAKYGYGEKPRIERAWIFISTGTREMGANHDIQWIKPGCPGARNFLIFNNNDQVYQSSSQSELIEINPYLDANKQNSANYVWPHEAGWHTIRPDFKTSHQFPRKRSNQIAWTYTANYTGGFFANHG
jgi:hypothetical protein